jgi:hypothetical protein
LDNRIPVISLLTIEIQKSYTVKNRSRQFGYWEICQSDSHAIARPPPLQYLDSLWIIRQASNSILSN